MRVETVDTSEPSPTSPHRRWLVVARLLVPLLVGALPGFVLSWTILTWNPQLWHVATAAGALIILAALVNWRLSTRLAASGLAVTRWRRVQSTFAVVVAFGVALIAQPAMHLALTVWNDRDDREPPPAGFVDDASRLNATRVAEVWDVPTDPAEAERQLVELLKRAARQGLKVSIAGARHSMGGHTIYPDGIVVNTLPFNRMELNEKTNVLHVQAGARWSDVLPYLDKRGRSIGVMQSNNSFSVGGSISVNCHGWQYGTPPIASTVQSFRLLKADGHVVRCSRKENSDLFSLALGGYGLFGIILDVDLRVVPNVRYRSEQFVVPIDDSLATFDKTVNAKPNAEMVFARLNIDPDRLLQDVVLNVYYRETGGEIPTLHQSEASRLKRAVLRGSARSDFGKRFRWFAETRLQPLVAERIVSRNQLLNEGVEVLENRSNETTDVLHEYFVPRSRIAGFVEDTRRIVREHDGNLLNVTVRSVEADTDTFLRYADQHVFALVMLFTQLRTEDGESRMQKMTSDLIDAALARGGRYYLPYRLHATVVQFHRAYPQARKFFELKRRHDPLELFQNRFYAKYGL